MKLIEIIITTILSIGGICFLSGGMLFVVYMTQDNERNYKICGKIAVTGIALLLIGLILIVANAK